MLWFGAFTSTVGTWMQKVAQSWLVLQLTGSTFYLGLDDFLGQLPILLLTLVGGVIADRHDRRRLLLGSQYVQMATAFTLAALVFWDRVHIGHVLALSFAAGLGQAFGGPAYQALIPSLVHRKDLPNAIALNSIQFNLARVIGPLLAGLAMAALGAAACFSLNGLSFVVVILAIMSLAVKHIHTGERKPILQEMWVTELDPNDAVAVADAVERLRTAEQQLTEYRKALHSRLDQATKELIDRYRQDPVSALVALARPHTRTGGIA